MPEAVFAGHPTHWRVFERGGARPVLALHCSLAHGGAWSGLSAGLSGVTITAPDLPGHGQSAGWDSHSDLHTLTTRIAAEMAAMLGQGRPVDVMGHSFGGTVALRLALERPDLVRSVILFEPVLFAAARAAGAACWPAFIAEHQEVAALYRSGQAEAAAMRFHSVWGGRVGFDDLPERQQHYMIDRIGLVMAQDATLVADSAALLRAMGLETLTQPVLLAEGAESPPVIPAICGELARRLPLVRRVTVPGAGHMLPITHPAQVAPAVQAHLGAC
ncbi:alpha/beta fold hydrolase [Neotabrizicola shimadae]|uniref:Alpha/beta hydrolase n=1 Tax=Neotabrizicola shimadae TaxID=2807096 RepID=A0A8G1EAQ7_9RHOB|nr:alpha/beta hydrolase [Neotabrizicola shimadae]QYZ68592.1 alpha/beta hydrolase [Neotabrizicola shimadae]